MFSTALFFGGPPCFLCIVWDDQSPAGWSHSISCDCISYDLAHNTSVDVACPPNHLVYSIISFRQIASDSSRRILDPSRRSVFQRKNCPGKNDFSPAIVEKCWCLGGLENGTLGVVGVRSLVWRLCLWAKTIGGRHL